jgi:hypothetical protein
VSSNSDKNLGAPAARVLCPAIAFGHHDVFDMGRHDYPHNEPDYREYRFLGRLPIGAYTETRTARVAAQAKFGPRANVFLTARYWVVHEIR